MKTHQEGQTTSAREAAAITIAGAAVEFPNIQPWSLDTASLDPRDARLALAITRGVAQRWLTLEYLLNLYLSKPLHTLEPSMQGVLLTAAAQLVYMDRLPAHAVVDESVELGRRLVRPAAAGLVNAVLRRLSEQVEWHSAGATWAPAANRLPSDDGVVVLRNNVLPPPDEIVPHLVAATSHPAALIERWLDQHGVEQTIELCMHGIVTPPTIVAVESNFDAAKVRDAAKLFAPHAQAGFIIWKGSNSELVSFLAANASRRVQDPGSSRPVASTAKLTPGLIVDFCAGRGTKTRQLAALHPAARVLATDIDKGRLADLRTAASEMKNVEAIECGKMPAAVVAAGGADLLLLDVPCSNTGVLARRPEARYRFNGANLQSIVALQRRIIRRAGTMVKKGGYLLYSTCSLERAENSDQANWIASNLGARLVSENQELPAGRGTAYHDGSYHALLKL